MTLGSLAGMQGGTVHAVLGNPISALSLLPHLLWVSRLLTLLRKLNGISLSPSTKDRIVGTYQGQWESSTFALLSVT